MEVLAEVLKDNESLKELYLYSNRLGPGDALLISKIIEKKRKLTSLGLSNNQIGADGAI